MNSVVTIWLVVQRSRLIRSHPAHVKRQEQIRQSQQPTGWDHTPRKLLPMQLQILTSWMVGREPTLLDFSDRVFTESHLFEAEKDRVQANGYGQDALQDQVDEKR